MLVTSYRILRNMSDTSKGVMRGAQFPWRLINMGLPKSPNNVK